jgi:phage protein D
MSSSFRLVFNGAPAEEEICTQMISLEVEESVDLPGAFQLHLPVSRSEEGDLTFVNDPRFGPHTNVGVIVTVEGKRPECNFDGFVLSNRLHLEKGTTSSTLEVWGQDASWLMNLEEKTREWVDMTDADVASAIFGDYGISPAPENSQDDSPAHTEDGHTLMQRASDIQFLRTLARRNGKLVRVVCGERAGERTGFFARPKLDSTPAATLKLNHPEEWNVDALDLRWDVSGPTRVDARQALFTDDAEEGVAAAETETGLKPLGERSLSDFAGKLMAVLLTAPVDDAGELSFRARALLREAAWFVRCEGEVDVARLGIVLRAGTVVEVAEIGSVHSGKYFVWSVRHVINQDSHKMRFVFVRNAVGPPPSGGGSFLGGLL